VLGYPAQHPKLSTMHFHNNDLGYGLGTGSQQRGAMHELSHSDILHACDKRSRPLRTFWRPLRRFRDGTALRDLLLQQHRPRSSIGGQSLNGSPTHPVRCAPPIKGIQKPFSLPKDINLVTRDKLLKHGAYDVDTQSMVVAR
jgi:hypothetical protein